MLGWGFPPNVSGGLDTHVGELFERLEARDDVDIELVLPAEYAPDREGIIGVPTGEGDIITRIGRLGSTFAERAADADIVHTHDWFGYGPGSRAKSNNKDVEWVTTFHSLSSDRNIDPPQREVETERRIAERCDHLLAVSELLAETVKAEYGGDCRVIYNGFSECETTGRDLKDELGIEGKMLFFVGRHTDQKGISHLVYALEKLDREDVTLVMGGSGHLTAQLKRFAELLDVEDQIEWVGYVPEEELGDYYASADLFVSPSLSEPFGITIVEALSAGTRVVATESGAAEVLPEDCVIEVEPDSRSIADGIEYGLSLDGEPEYEPYTWDQVVDETVAFYHEIIEETD
ncbi:glycosyltransferase family 1 protein [Haloferax mediterranei ATCC 33500]|nr:glycosyltransferase family 4 protein [Haloferax mediterranei]AHZ21512.1 glycosyl transferase family 1 [Haloferax mediterranei ATCC 33500]EMA03972.1 LPS glycosyltransferase [Haloferax mediterranei ATCC 33500]MDX5989223.1 glycosyltransferase family 4 protein [Haloferax mediterranei ATCC 33500]QCQ76645.1 glycosyltransferase family 1 protein [Haloferax mediterranei ATCC 33500]